MTNYNTETWTIRDVAEAFKYTAHNNDITDRKVVIPIFQRGLRWDSSRRRAFIDSLEKGYPFGSLLFAKQEGINKYSVVDGLQRGSTVCDYVFNPLGQDNIITLDSTVIDAVRKVVSPDEDSVEVGNTIQNIILEYFHERKQFDSVQMLTLAGKIYDSIPNDQDKFDAAERIQNAIQPFFDDMKKKYNAICGSPVPIVVYSGPQELLNDIFNRINTKGIPLNDYEIYSATWSQETYEINDVNVVENVIKKYWMLMDSGYQIDGFDANNMRRFKKLTAFEFLFGLGKLWHEEYECLKFDSKGKDDEINEISFEIIDACINSKKSIPTLDKQLKNIDVNKLKKRVEEAIEFVSDAISVIGKFKGNKRKYNVLHSKYQIISLVSYVFRAMYKLSDLDIKRVEWTEEYKSSLSSLLLCHYVADIISNEWHDGGAAKVYLFNKDKRYEERISERRWELLLDNYFQNQLDNRQRDRFSNPVNADSVILNCIYVDLFSAKDHLSSEKFDIEHLATKERMRTIMKQFNDLKLPVSCIANYCYLPAKLNRGKREKILYEVKDLEDSIKSIEEKYSFTVESDFQWMFVKYDKVDAEKFRSSFVAYLDSRYLKIKERFIRFFYPDYSVS